MTSKLNLLTKAKNFLSILPNCYHWQDFFLEVNLRDVDEVAVVDLEEVAEEVEEEGEEVSEVDVVALEDEVSISNFLGFFYMCT